MKAAVYAATRNLYVDMLVSIQSLLNNSSVDKVYCLIEDDELPYEIDPKIEVLNMANQQWFPKDGPNYYNRWTYMPLLRTILTKIFPDLDYIVSFDDDIIINENIDELWNIDMTPYYVAGVEERITYINFGVVVLNLKRLREDHIDDLMLKTLNTKKVFCPEQDLYNSLCRGQILFLPIDYNISAMTINNRKITNHKIFHYGNAGDSTWRKAPLYQHYYYTLYTKQVLMYLNYLTVLEDNSKNIPTLWKEYKQAYATIKNKSSEYKQNFKYHIKDFKCFTKPGYLLSIDKFIEDLKTSDEPSTGYLKI